MAAWPHCCGVASKTRWRCDSMTLVNRYHRILGRPSYIGAISLVQDKAAVSKQQPVELVLGSLSRNVLCVLGDHRHKTAELYKYIHAPPSVRTRPSTVRRLPVAGREQTSWSRRKKLSFRRLNCVCLYVRFAFSQCHPVSSVVSGFGVHMYVS